MFRLRTLLETESTARLTDTKISAEAAERKCGADVVQHVKRSVAVARGSLIRILDLKLRTLY